MTIAMAISFVERAATMNYKYTNASYLPKTIVTVPDTETLNTKIMVCPVMWRLYTSLHYGSDCDTGSLGIFHHFGNSSLGQLPYRRRRKPWICAAFLRAPLHRQND